MHGRNQTRVTEFLLLGFTRIHISVLWVFFLILPIYLVTVTGNLLIITLIVVSPHLSSPMYYFLANLYLSDIVLTTNIVPKMLSVLWREGETISFSGCLFQFYMYGAMCCVECLLLTVMSYDRYLAICKPLQYTTIMDISLSFHLIFWSWLFGLMIPTIPIFLICNLQFCDSNTIDHFFCDLDPLLRNSCSDPSFVKLEILIASVPLTFLPLLLIILSYSYIFITVLRIPSSSGQHKAFSTCSSHLTVVCAYYGALCSLYIVPSSGHSRDTNKFLSLLYTVLTPLLNPIIYGLRSQDIRKAMKKYF